MEFVPNTLDLHQPPWRNWLARSAVNRKVGGSSPPGGALPFVPVKTFTAGRDRGEKIR